MIDLILGIPIYLALISFILYASCYVLFILNYYSINLILNVLNYTTFENNLLNISNSTHFILNYFHVSKTTETTI